jgi:DNA primase
LKSFQQEDFYQICAFAANWFEQQLQNETAFEARQFLQARTISKTICDKWNIGFCPAESENDFLAALEAAGFSAGLALLTGLFIHDRKRLQLRAAYTDRLVIPKRDASGKVAGFGARLLTAPTPFIPKYIQSAETCIYSMYDLLFGLDRAKKAIAEKGFVIIAEGYFDVIRLHESGIVNSVSLIGTRIGKGQLSLLRQYSSRILIVFDGDEPGYHGAALLESILKKENYEVAVLHLPANEDPDSILQSAAGNEFDLLLKQDWVAFV